MVDSGCLTTRQQRGINVVATLALYFARELWPTVGCSVVLCPAGGHCPENASLGWGPLAQSVLRTGAEAQRLSSVEGWGHVHKNLVQMVQMSTLAAAVNQPQRHITTPLLYAGGR